MADMAIKAKAQDVNAVAKFETDMHNLLEILNKSDVEVLPPGTALKIYATSGTLSDESVAEKALIPDSGIKVGDAEIVELTFGKYRNLVSIEDIAKKGYETAVGGANNDMLKQALAKARKSIFTGMAKGTGEAQGSTFQEKVAKAAAYVQKKFEDEACTPIFFASTDDAYEYLGTASVGLAQNFGLSYIENFMGIGNVIIDSNVPSGTIYGTATENLEVVAADLSGIDGVELQMDVAGIIGVHTAPAYANGAVETVVYSGLGVKPAIKDRIVKVTTI